MFFYKVVIPGVNFSKDDGINKISTQLSNNIVKLKNQLKEDISDIKQFPKMI